MERIKSVSVILGEIEQVVDSVRSREPSPYGIAFGDSILPIPNGQDSAALGFARWGNKTFRLASLRMTELFAEWPA